MALNEDDEFELLSLERQRAQAVKPAAESPYSLKNLAGAAVEPTLAIGTGSIAAPISGLAGILGSLLPGPEGQGADWTKKVGSALSYEPKTSGGQIATDVITKPFQLLGNAGNYLGEKTTDITGSPALGAGVNAAFQAAAPLGIAKAVNATFPARATENNLSPQVNLLAEKGIPMTPGQMRGGMLNRVEQGFESVPWLGDMIKQSRARGTESFNRVVADDVLSTVNETLPKDVRGQQAIQHVRETLGAKYDDLLPKMTGTLDAGLKADLDVVKNSGQYLPRQQRADLSRIIKDNVEGPLQNGTVTGQTMKDIFSSLSKEISDYGRGGTYERKVAESLKDAQAAIRGMTARENPQLAPELSVIDQAYAKFKLLQKAASYGKEGTFTPGNMVQAIKKTDVTKDKRAYTEGTAGRGMQPLAEAARSVLPNTLPDSGTPYRQLFTLGALGGDMGLTHLLNPYTGALVAGVPSIYNPVSLSALQNLALRPLNAGHIAATAAPIGALEQVQRRQE